jgi:hypothetical protein
VQQIDHSSNSQDITNMAPSKLVDEPPQITEPTHITNRKSLEQLVKELRATPPPSLIEQIKRSITRALRTDTDIPSGPVRKRELQKWEPPNGVQVEIPLGGRLDGWDQFAAAGGKSTYDEHDYTTKLDTSAPGYAEKLARASRIAGDIDTTLPLTKKITIILPASSVTTDFNELRFDAAARLQVQVWLPGSMKYIPSDPRKDPHQLISSPYNHPEHLLDLRTLDTPNRLFALALTGMKPLSEDYARGEYLESFNWKHVLDTLRKLAEDEGHQWTEQKFYTVIFQSKLNEDIDRALLGDLDQHSHREATEFGGLLKYWFGAANEERENLATCKFLFSL